MIRTPGDHGVTRPRATAANHRRTKDQHVPPSCVGLYRSTPSDRIAMIKDGLEASVAEAIITTIPGTRTKARRAVDIPQATTNRWVRGHAKLPPAGSERVLGVGRLVGQVEAMVEESGDPGNFDARAWLTRWLGEPLAAFGGVRPRDLPDTIEERRTVSEALARTRSGACA